MSKISIEQLVTSPSTLNYLSTNAYDHTKWNLGRGLVYNDGLTESEKYVTPDFQVFRPMEESVPFAVSQIEAYNLNSDVCYVFGVEALTTAVATRRVHLWELNRKTGVKGWKGFITMTLATSTAHTVRDFKVDIKNESTGTVAVSGTAVTGTGTLFVDNKVAIGARIGFGSTNPGQITQWFRVTARGSNTGLTLNTSAGTIAGGTPYVIQEFRPIYTATNATTTNGGVHYGKGVTIEDFTPGGTTIPLAVSTDDQKAMYWIKDAATVVNVGAAGAVKDTSDESPTNLTLYVLNTASAGNYNVFKYNLRAPLTVAAGASVSAFLLSTANQAVVGSVSQNANLALATTTHGSGSGVPSLYFVTSTRVYRAAVSNITSGNPTWQSDSIVEMPPGGTNTQPLTNALVTITHVSAIDRFVIGSNHTGGLYSYVTRYVASTDPFDKTFGRDYKLFDHSTRDADCPLFFNNNSTTCTYTDAGGSRVFAVKQGTTIALNQIYVMSFGADWDYASVSQGRLISPEIPTPNALKYSKVVADHIDFLGSSLLGKPTEAIRLLARTSNIATDETSGWISVPSNGDISGLVGAASIQFAIEFRTIGETCLPSRILGINLSYEDNTTDSHFALSVGKSSLALKEFAFWFKQAFVSTVPALRISLYNADTGGLLVTDTTTASANGEWEKTTDGSTWTAYNTTDRGNSTTWIRYTPTSLADNVKVQAYLTQA